DGPTKITVSPALISMETLSTAGFGFPGYFLVRFSSWMVAPEVASAPSSTAIAPVSVSGTDPPRDGQPSQQDVRGVEEQGEDHDAERAREDLVHRVGAAQRRDAAEDLVAE